MSHSSDDDSDADDDDIQATTPNRNSYILFFKNRKTTTLMHAMPTATLAAVKAELYKLLHENSAHLTEPTEAATVALRLPAEPDDIVLGAPIDPAGTDVTKGFHVVSGQDSTSRKTTLRDAGLKDGAVLAWKLRADGRFTVEAPAEEDDEPRA